LSALSDKIAVSSPKEYWVGMGKRGIINRYASAFALLAAVLFSYASVRSTIMQAQMAVPGMEMQMCGSMAGSVPQHGDHSGKSSKTCEFCSAAAHAPICSSTQAFIHASTLTWAHYASLRPLGPRGPPEFTAKSQGPPVPVLTV
jgi:hypothetical protein